MYVYGNGISTKGRISRNGLHVATSGLVYRVVITHEEIPEHPQIYYGGYVNYRQPAIKKKITVFVMVHGKTFTKILYCNSDIYIKAKDVKVIDLGRKQIKIEVKIAMPVV